MSEKTIEKTDRGFAYIDFSDLYGNPCSIRESSLATETAIWIGFELEGHRMHLNREAARWLSRMLAQFAEKGHLPGADDP